jgi:chitodextrinase
VEARRGRGAKEAQQWTEGNETNAEKIGRNCKKTQKTQKHIEKKNTTKHQNKNQNGEGGG